MLSPAYTDIDITCPSCETELELRVKQTPSYMKFVVSVEEIKAKAKELVCTCAHYETDHYMGLRCDRCGCNKFGVAK